MAATMQHCATTTPNGNNSTPSTPKNPQLKRIVYSKYRELLGSYNDKANAIIDTLPAYMVREDRGFQFDPALGLLQQVQGSRCGDSDSNEMYGAPSGQRQAYEAPACVQNAMMTKDKKPFTYTPGGIDLSQIKSERMAKRLARNAQAEGATGASQHNRPTQPQSPPGGTAAAMGAAAMGMPFQVLPPPPPPPAPSAVGKKTNGGPAPPPPPPPSSTSTLAPPPINGSSAPGSPSAARKSPTPQRFEPPPLGFRPEIKIPTNPMAALRKVPPPVEKNTFWKDEYVKDRSPMLGEDDRNTSPTRAAAAPNHSNGGTACYGESNNNNNNNNGSNNMYSNNNEVDGFKNSMPPTTTTPQQLETNNYNNSNYNQQYSPHHPQQHIQQPLQQQYSAPPQPPTPPQQQQQQQQQFRSVVAPQSPAVNIYTRQTDSPGTGTPPQGATDSPFKFAQQQQLQQQRTPPAISPLAQQQSQQQPPQQQQANTPPSAGSAQAQSAVPWRTQRGSQPSAAAPQQQQSVQQPQSRSQPIYNNVPQVQPQQQLQQQRSPDLAAQQYQGPKPTNVGSLYIAPLAPPVEPQAQNIVRKQLLQQQQQRDSPIRQLPQQQQQQPQQQQPQQQQPRQPARWMSSQAAKDQPDWARPEENGNVMPSSLQRMKSSPPPQMQQQAQQQQQRQQQQQQQQQYPQPPQGNGFSNGQNFGAQTHAAAAAAPTGLRLQINLTSATSPGAPKERIIPIQLEATPTYSPAQPSFNAQSFGSTNANAAPASYVIRSPNQFVDQGYNNFTAAQQQQMREPSAQRVMSPTQQLNAPRMIQQQQQLQGTNITRIIPIAVEGGEGTRGPISQTPIVIQKDTYNIIVHDCPLEAEIRYRKSRLSDPRSPPVQSKSFRILQKITDTTDDGKSSSAAAADSTMPSSKNESFVDPEPALQRPQFARQMSAQQARNSPTIEQMRRMQIAHDQQQQPQAWNQQGNNAAVQPNEFIQQRPTYNNNNDMSPQYIHPSEQQVPEPKKYTGSAIPSRSFKILQAMTTPENAAEMEDSESVELNENQNKNNNNQNYNYNQNNAEIISNNHTNSNTTTPTPTPPPTSTSSSTSSINSEATYPTHYPPPYGYPYPYPYPYPPMPNMANSGEQPPGMPNWQHYPYPMPPPPHLQMQMPTQQPGDMHHPNYPPYPYYYHPYYPPPYPPPSNQSSQSSLEYDSQNVYDPKVYPPFVAQYPYPYPYPVVPSYSQSSNSSRASSVLPDIIVTPSTDDIPSQVILQHHIKVEKRKPPKRPESLEIVEINSRTQNSKLKREQREGSVIDVLTKRLEDIQRIGETNLNLSNDTEKHYVGEHDKEFDEKSPIDNTSPVERKSIKTKLSVAETPISESSDDDSEITPKCEEKKVGLQAIKSVTNVQVYKQNQNHAEEDSDDDDDDDDVTTADGESDIFDEEDDEEHAVEELEIDECIEEDDDEDFENLSVIYEEESELEHSSEHPKTVIKRDSSSASDATTIDKADDDLAQQIEEHDDEDSTSVTVRLPLKFSFSRSSNDENIATVEVGNSQIEERRNSVSLSEKRNSFSIATLDDSENEKDGNDAVLTYDDDCDVSVTISLTASSRSRSGSIDRKHETRNISDVYPVEDMPIPETLTENLDSSHEDVSVSFSLNMRNKFLDQTIKDDVTNNISEIVKECPKDDNKTTEPAEELDFFATLRATKMQAQKMMEKSASYWGKSTENKPETKNVPTTETKVEEVRNIWADKKDEFVPKSDVVEDIWADIEENSLPKPKVITKPQCSLETANNSFWSTVADATTIKSASLENAEDNKEVDFWAAIEDSKQDNEWTSKKKTVTCVQIVREDMEEVKYWESRLKARVEALPQSQRAEIHIQEDKTQLLNNTDQLEEDEEEDFWASVEQAKSMSRLTDDENYVMPQVEDRQEVDFWAEIDRNQSNQQAFDHTKYPEEPREVDTDEEIDFWAEIEAKKNKDDDEVTFHKSATFWAKNERQNSVDETPYKLVQRKAFLAKLPDEPTVDVNIWAALEAAKGEEPIIVDPAVEEEKALAEEFNLMPNEETDSDDVMTETASVHEPIVANVWEPAKNIWEPSANVWQPIVNESEPSGNIWEPAVNVWEPITDIEKLKQTVADEEPDFWAASENDREETKVENEPTNGKTEQRDELEIKRNNYRKAMAFFTTSVDDHKEQSVDKNNRSGKSSNRTSIIEEESGKWDWQATAEITQPELVTETIQQKVQDTEQTSLYYGGYEMVNDQSALSQPNELYDTNNFDDDKDSSSSESNSTPTNFESKIPEIEQTYIEQTQPMKLLPNGLPDLGVSNLNSEQKISVRDRIFAFETGTTEPPESKKLDIKAHSLSVESYSPKSSLSRNSSSQRSESEMEEDDSGVTDMNKQLSETDTESESFPELRKMTSYQRAATHSRLFKLLQDDDIDECKEDKQSADEFQFKPSRRKIVHNVSITRKQNPKVLAEAESMTQRRERLSLPLRKNTSIDADNPSTPNSPASPIMGEPSANRVVNDKLVNELVQSLLLKRDSSHLRHLPMEKLQAAAKRALEQELDSLENTSVETTPALTPNEVKSDKGYSDYYDSWSDASGGSEIVPSKAFRALQEQPGSKRSPWSVRCPRVLSSKTINRDLARVTESPEIFSRSSKSPECFSRSREGSISSWKKV